MKFVSYQYDTNDWKRFRIARIITSDNRYINFFDDIYYLNIFTIIYLSTP